jgi:Domain of unknown function (DUF4177)
MWEYKTVRTNVLGFQKPDAKWFTLDMGMIPTEVLDEMLNELGIADWELVNFSQIGTDLNTMQLLFVLKRPRKN